jgi:hypothetical protein
MGFTLVAELTFIATHKEQIPNPIEFVLVNYGGQIIHRPLLRLLRIYFADRLCEPQLERLRFFRHTKLLGVA